MLRVNKALKKLLSSAGLTFGHYVKTKKPKPRKRALCTARAKTVMTHAGFCLRSKR